jgi:type I restriction enzyme R subunit
MFNRKRLRDIIQNSFFLPDSSKKKNENSVSLSAILCSSQAFENIKSIKKNPLGDGKGGTYFGTTGCGKSYTMLYLSRLLMRSTYFASPTIIIIQIVRLDDQLSGQFTNAKGFVGDESITV